MNASDLISVLQLLGPVAICAEPSLGALALAFYLRRFDSESVITAAPAEGKMRLEDAARIAANILGTDQLGISAARFGAKPNDTLVFYCFRLARLASLYGRQSPSSALQRLDRDVALDLRFSVRQQKIEAKELTGMRAYVDLQIDMKSFRDALERLKSHADPRRKPLKSEAPISGYLGARRA